MKKNLAKVGIHFSAFMLLVILGSGVAAFIADEEFDSLDPAVVAVAAVVYFWFLLREKR